MLDLSPALLDAGWRLLTATPDLGAFMRSNGFPRRLLITFDTMHANNHGRQRVSGDAVAMQCAADHLHLGTTRAEWYQSEELPGLIAVARAIRDTYDEAILYGHSMGAYAALLLSGPLAASSVVAFAPQFSVNPLTVPFENRFLAYTANVGFAHDDMRATMSKTARKLVVYDPYCELDRKHFDLISQCPNIVPLPIPFAGHYPNHLLLEAGILRQTVVDLLLQTVPTGEIRKRTRVARRRSSRYFLERALHLANRRQIMKAFDCVNTAYVLQPTSPAVLEAYQTLLMTNASYYGLAHAMLRLVGFEQPQWTHYEPARKMIWGELEKTARTIIDKPV